MPEFAITASGLVKRYGDLTAVNGLDLNVPAGSIYALLGPNGAGKTTTISILTTLILPSAGSAQVAGFDVVREANQVRAQIGVTFQEIAVDLDLSGREVLDIHGRLYRQPTAVRHRRISELVELVQLGDALDRRVRTYSGGMKRRLELARGLLTEPTVLFLDEPTQGLDPQNRDGIWRYLRELNQRHGLSLLLTTHYMDEAETLAARVGIVDHGRLVAEGPPAELAAALGADVIRVRGQGDVASLAAHLTPLPFVDRVDTDASNGMAMVYVDSGSRRLVEVLGSIGSHGFNVDDVTVARPSLGDVFLHHTGRALRD